MNYTKVTTVVVYLSLAACAGNRSAYHPETPVQEIVWNYDDELLAVRDGEIVATSNSWSGLADAVGCVPGARELADDAGSKSLARILTWSGSATFAAGTVGGAYLVLGAERRKEGYATMLGSITVGITAMVFGLVTMAESDRDGIDAVNLYNDEYRDEPGCRAKASSGS